MSVVADQIIQSHDDSYMKLLSNFKIIQFNEIFNVLSPVLASRRHRDAICSPRTMLLITLCHLKHNEAWRKIAAFFGVSPSYCYSICNNAILTCHQMLKEKFITWISVSDRITKFNQRYLDYPTLLGSVDATVQRISRPKDDQHFIQANTNAMW